MSAGFPSGFEEYGFFCRVQGSSSAYQSIFGALGNASWKSSADIFAGIHSLITDDYVASLTYALFFVAIHAVMGVWMYHKKIFIKL